MEFETYVRELVAVPTAQDIKVGQHVTVARLDFATLRQAIRVLAPDDAEALLARGGGRAGWGRAGNAVGRVPALLGSVVGGLLGDDHVVHVALLEPRGVMRTKAAFVRSSSMVLQPR